MGELTSTPIASIGRDDHVRGTGPEVIVYMDLACFRCAAIWPQLAALPLRLCVRHFPIASRAGRSPALHAATEAAAMVSESAFWQLWDSLYANRGYQDDPHLWERAREAGLDLDRFERDRRSASVAARVDHDFRGGIRAGVTGTPAAFLDGSQLPGDPMQALMERFGVESGRGEQERR